MGLLDFLFGKTETIEDSFFGKMVLIEFRKKPENNYFECRRNFKPINDIIEISVKDESERSFDSQKEFFRNIETNYQTIIESIAPMIENEFRNWKDGFRIDDFTKEFRADYIAIPSCRQANEEWEIAFNSVHDPYHNITITMEGLQAIDILIDG